MYRDQKQLDDAIPLYERAVTIDKVRRLSPQQDSLGRSGSMPLPSR